MVDGIVREVFRCPAGPGRLRRADRGEGVGAGPDTARAGAGVRAHRRGGVRARRRARPEGRVRWLRRGGSARRGRARATRAARAAQVRAYLVPRARGGSRGPAPTGSSRLQRARGRRRRSARPPPLPSPRPAPAPHHRTATPAAAATGQPQPEAKSAVASLGLTGEALKVQGRFVLKVTSTEPGGPAQHGDRAGRRDRRRQRRSSRPSISSTPWRRRGGTLNLIVLDINSGKGARVAVDLTGTKAGGPVAVNPNQPAPAPAPVPSPAPVPPRRSLGFSAEPVSLGLHTGMKIVTVDKGSLAEKAGSSRATSSRRSTTRGSPASRRSPPALHRAARSSAWPSATAAPGRTRC